MSYRWTPAVCTLGYLIVTCASAAATSRMRDDPTLSAALAADPQLQRCACIRGAAWLDESYPRITVDAARWRALGAAGRAAFSARALQDAESVYASQWGTPDIYREIFIVDRRGKLLATHQA